MSLRGCCPAGGLRSGRTSERPCNARARSIRNGLLAWSLEDPGKPSLRYSLAWSLDGPEKPNRRYSLFMAYMALHTLALNFFVAIVIETSS